MLSWAINSLLLLTQPLKTLSPFGQASNPKSKGVRVVKGEVEVVASPRSRGSKDVEVAAERDTSEPLQVRGQLARFKS